MSGRHHHGLLLAVPILPIDDLNDIAMVGRYEVWRDTPGVDTTPIPFLTDWSGNGNDLTQSTSGSRPTITNGPIPGFPSISAATFDGTDDFLISASIPAMTNTDTRWYYCVFRYDGFGAPATFPVAFAGDNSSGFGQSDSLLYGNVGTQLLIRFGYASSSANQIAINTPLDFHLCSIVGDGSNVESKMGVALIDDVTAQSSDQPTGTFKIMLGALGQGSPGNFFTGKIAALFVGNTVQTTLEKTRIAAYLLSVYGQAP